MDEDDLTDGDVIQIILHGAQVAKLTDDPRGYRYVVRGSIENRNIEVEVVCRFLPSNLMRIITAYVLEE